MWAKLSDWARQHWQDLVVVSVLLAVAGVVTATNFTQYPMRFEDEGTYVAQAWAVQYRGELAHYTYWYDHPPVAWLQIALYNTVTFAFDRYESAISAGREFMIILHLVSVGLLYALARRLHMNKAIAAVATALFALSPLTIEFSRLVLLDNVALPWLLGAFLLALVPRRHLVAYGASAVCMAMAVLSKETFLIFLPALLYAMYQNSDQRNRRYGFVIFGALLAVLGMFYVLFAALKGELIPGEGHVSLLGTVGWQLFGRESSGSLLQAGSDAQNLLNFWLSIDFWLLTLGVLMTPLLFIRRHLRPFGVFMLIGVLMAIRPGYLPYPYIIALLPFAALAIGGALHMLIGRPLADQRAGTRHALKRRGAEIASVAVMLAGVVFIAPSWYNGAVQATQVQADSSSRQAVNWVAENVPRDNLIVVESALWVDLQEKGFDQPDPVWLYKTETDPEVKEKIGGWRGMDYLVLNGPTLNESSRKDFPTVFTAKDHGEVVAEFGKDERKVVVIKVDHSR